MTPLILAFAAGVGYGLAAIFLKRALETGAGTFRSLAYSNWFITIFFIPFPLLAEEGFTRSEIELGSMLGVLFCASQTTCFLALRRGDASVATPIMGTKTLFVAIFGYFIYAKSLPDMTWLAAILAVGAVILLGWPAKGAKPSMLSMGLAMVTAAGFGLTDALVPEFAKAADVDPFNLLFMMVFSVGVLSFLFIPMTRGRFLGWRGQADKWL
ncbi:MAG: DMT family transporter, partial [Opitutales bacterium]